MGKIVVTEFVWLDGVFEEPGGAEGFEHGGWSFTFSRGEVRAGVTSTATRRSSAITRS